MKLYTLYLIALLAMPACAQVYHPAATAKAWKTAYKIVDNIQETKFPARDFPVQQYGAVGDGMTDCTRAFAQAIAACHAAGGGRVIVPAGRYLTGPIHLKSHVNLVVGKDAVILFTQDTRQYLPLVLTRFEGVELMNYSPLIYAYDQENIAITGEGTLDGQADIEHWWYMKGRWAGSPALPGKTTQADANKKLREMAANGVPVEQRIFGEGFSLRPNFIEPYRCKRVLIEGITIINAPSWVLHPVLSEDVIIRKVTVNSHGPNNDGCDPESSRRVWIKDCYFDTGDDCIAIKSGRDADGRRVNVPTEDVVIQGCTMKDGHGGVVIGSEITGNVRNVFAEHCVMSSPNLDRALRIKSNPNRGGIIENIYMRHVQVGQVANANVHIDLTYDRETGNNPPVVRNIFVEDMQAQQSEYAVYVKADPAHPVKNVVIANSNFKQVEKANYLEGIENLVMHTVSINGKAQ